MAVAVRAAILPLVFFSSFLAPGAHCYDDDDGYLDDDGVQKSADIQQHIAISRPHTNEAIDPGFHRRNLGRRG